MITITILVLIIFILTLYLIFKVLYSIFISFVIDRNNKLSTKKIRGSNFIVENYMHIAKDCITNYFVTQINDFELKDIIVENQSLFIPVDPKIDIIYDDNNRNIIGTDLYKEKDWKKFYWDITIVYISGKKLQTGKSKIGFLIHEKSGIYSVWVIPSNLSK